MKDFGLFNQVIKKGIQKIRETDSKAQDEFIEIICKDVRGMDPKSSTSGKRLLRSQR